MGNVISRFAGANAKLAKGFDRIFAFPPASVGTLYPNELKTMFAEASTIADVGGGKKPYALAVGRETGGKIYLGLDLDADELARAPAGSYTETSVMNICAPDKAFACKFDLIICHSTLEHVTDTDAAIAGLAFLLAPGGRCFVKLPCRKAVFARLNLLLPNETKRRIMHLVFPHKKGDGFPAHYERCLPSAVRGMAQSHRLAVIAEKRNYRSSYFSFFLPLYLVWRGVAVLQYLLDRDYCESFEMVFRKPEDPARP